MKTVDVSFAKARLSMLVDRATKAEAFVIAKRGKPLVKVVAIDAPQQQPIRRLGFLEGRTSVADDFDTMFAPDPAQASLPAITPCPGAKAKPWTKSQTRLVARATRRRTLSGDTVTPLVRGAVYKSALASRPAMG